MTFESDDSANQAALPAVATLAGWLICLLIGGVGLLIPYPRPQVPPADPPPVQAQLINVRISDAEPPTHAAPSRPPSDASPPAAPTVEAPLPAPVLASPFAEHIAQPKPQAPIENGRVVVQLTMGVGQGRQPRPEYPRDSVIAHQEGTVVVEFDIDQNGAVSNVEAVSRAPFALLNQAAVDTIRDEWRFGPGPLRRGRISIIFKLNER
jgi:TonB family protein